MSARERCAVEGKAPIDEVQSKTSTLAAVPKCTGGRGDVHQLCCVSMSGADEWRAVVTHRHWHRRGSDLDRWAPQNVA
eukprot:5328865-Amphidinium_carterae.1